MRTVDYHLIIRLYDWVVRNRFRSHRCASIWALSGSVANICFSAHIAKDACGLATSQIIVSFRLEQREDGDYPALKIKS
jgi:hypothetical protein